MFVFGEIKMTFNLSCKNIYRYNFVQVSLVHFCIGIRHGPIPTHMRSKRSFKITEVLKIEPNGDKNQKLTPIVHLEPCYFI